MESISLSKTPIFKTINALLFTLGVEIFEFDWIVERRLSHEESPSIKIRRRKRMLNKKFKKEKQEILFHSEWYEILVQLDK